MCSLKLTFISLCFQPLKTLKKLTAKTRGIKFSWKCLLKHQSKAVRSRLDAFKLIPSISFQTNSRFQNALQAFLRLIDCLIGQLFLTNCDAQGTWWQHFTSPWGIHQSTPRIQQWKYVRTFSRTVWFIALMFKNTIIRCPLIVKQIITATISLFP